jgi:hypothetical protein
MAIQRSDSELTMADRDVEKQALGAIPAENDTAGTSSSKSKPSTTTTTTTTTSRRDFDTSADPARPARPTSRDPAAAGPVYPTRTRSRRGTFGSEAGMHVGEVLEKIPTALQPALSFISRIHHFTFAWYTVT